MRKLKVNDIANGAKRHKRSFIFAQERLKN